MKTTAKIKPCPFCGSSVEVSYEPVVAYSIDCCVSMSLQICDALQDAGCRWDKGMEHDADKSKYMYGEYSQEAKDITKLALIKQWNKRT